MKILGYNVNFTNSQQNAQNQPSKVSLNFKSQKLNSDSVSFAQKPVFTDGEATRLLWKEIIGGENKIPLKEAQQWFKAIINACKKHEIKPADLPINAEHPGSLTAKQLNKLITESIYQTAPDPNKIKLLS